MSKLDSSLVQDLSNALISQWKKEAMRSSIKTLKKKIIDGDKAAKAKLVGKVKGHQIVLFGKGSSLPLAHLLSSTSSYN